MCLLLDGPMSTLARIVAAAGLVISSLSITPSDSNVDTAVPSTPIIGSFARSFSQSSARIDGQYRNALFVQDAELGVSMICVGSAGSWTRMSYTFGAAMPAGVVDADSQYFDAFSEYCDRQQRFYESLMRV